MYLEECGGEEGKRQWKRERIIRAGGTFLISLCFCIVMLAPYIYSKSQLEWTEAELVAINQANEVSDVIEQMLYKTHILATLVIQQEDEVRGFEQMAKLIIDDPAIRNLILAPDGVVQRVYPLADNEEVIGLDYFSPGEGNDEAMRARDTGQLILGGPFHLIQGGEALVGRLPVYRENIKDDAHFWGIVSVTLNYPEILEGANLEQMELHGYGYEIWRISPDTNQKQIIAQSDTDLNNGPYVEHKVNILNAEWYFRLAPLKKWYQNPETWIFVFGSLLISIIAALLVLHNYDLRRMGKKLETLSYQDGLTGAWNRRGLTRELARLMSAPGSSFILCYIDLDRFKDINDSFGHYGGDIALQYFTRQIRDQIRSRDLLARIGGDEFIVIFTGITDCKIAQMKLQQLEARLYAEPLVLSEGQVRLQFSAGLISYPMDGLTVDELLKAADRKMYSDKQAENEQ